MRAYWREETTYGETSKASVLRTPRIQGGAKLQSAGESAELEGFKTLISMSLSACTGHNNSDDVRPRVHSRRAVLAFHHRVGRIYSGFPETRIALSPVDKLSSRSLGQSLMGDGRRRGLAASGELCPGVKQTLNPPFPFSTCLWNTQTLSLPTFTHFSLYLIREVTPGQTQQGRRAPSARRSPRTTTTLA